MFIEFYSLFYDFTLSPSTYINAFTYNCIAKKYIYLSVDYSHAIK